jgi:hypothetical protein
MARSISEIFDSMKAQGIALATAAANQPAIDMFNSTSRVAVWKILFYAVAFCINALEVIYDLFRIEIDDTIAALKPHSARWYASKANGFQYGYNLIAETDTYDNSALTQQQIDDSKVVAYAAVVDGDRGIRIKLARLSGGDLAALTAPQLAAFTAYMQQIKDAGIGLLITSTAADDIKCTLRIFYNAQVLGADGSRNDGTNATPVQTAFNDYLKALPFNGLFVPMLMIDHLQAVEGVVIVKDDQWQSRYSALPYTNIDVEVTPDAGYLRLLDPADLDITFIPHSLI